MQNTILKHKNKSIKRGTNHKEDRIKPKGCIKFAEKNVCQQGYNEMEQYHFLVLSQNQIKTQRQLCQL